MNDKGYQALVGFQMLVQKWRRKAGRRTIGYADEAAVKTYAKCADELEHAISVLETLLRHDAPAAGEEAHDDSNGK